MNKNKKEERDLAAVSYLPFICLIALYRRRDSDFIQFHAKQGTVIFAFMIIAYILGEIGGIFSVIEKATYIILLSVIVIGFTNASQGEKYEIPFIKNLAKGEWDSDEICQNIKKAYTYIGNLFARLLNKKNQNK